MLLSPSSMDERTWYPLAQEWWSDQGSLVVRDESGQRLLVIPIHFVQAGFVATYAYVLDQVHSAYVEEGSVQIGERAAELQDPVQAGIVQFRRTDGKIEPCTPRRGPRFKYRFRAPTEGEACSTMSNSKRSSANQSRFREALLARDGACLVTDTLYESCTAAHILPQSRPEYYEEILGYDVRYLFMPSYGILLRDDLHHAFDRGEIALYAKGDDLIIHLFTLQNPELRHFHGKVLPPGRFRGPADRRPHRGLLSFHYTQTQDERAESRRVKDAAQAKYKKAARIDSAGNFRKLLSELS